MSLFQCYECGCRENTATSNFWLRMGDAHSPTWRGVQSQKWMLCSACDPDMSKWHGKFERVFLPKGEFMTNAAGNLEHIETGETDVKKFALSQQQSEVKP